MNRILTQGDHLQLEGKNFCIIRGIGAGASCVVYLAECADGTQHLLKEYNPRRLELYREENGTLCVEDEEDAEKYAEGLDRFAAGAEKQKTIRRSIDELTNSTSNVQGVYAANGTMYIDMTVFRGQSYEKVREQSMFDLLRRMRALTQVIGSYHSSGYLHLDVKPENIFAIPETCEMVMLFDFDSVTEKTAIQEGAVLSYTKSWAAPEQVRGCAKQLCEATDLFSVGEMVFWQVFGRHSAESERRSYSRYVFDMDAAICKNVNPKLFPLLEELFHHTLCFDVKKRYQSAGELLAMLDRLIPLADPKEPYLVSAQAVPEDFFIGRENELASIRESLQANHVLFLSGMGGIGKSELAKNYAKQFSKDYDTILFATYMGSWQMLITDDLGIHIANFGRYRQEPEKEYCARKIAKLAELCDERTLFIIDNVNEDSYESEETELFKRLMGLNCHFLFTTRLRDWEYPVLEIGTFRDRADTLRLFAEWCPYSAEQKPEVEAIIDYVAGHTLTVELIAKQIRAGFSTPDKMLQKLNERGIGSSGKDNVKSSKDNVVKKKTAFEHICDLFEMAALSESEKYVLFNMVLIPPTGIDGRLFMEWCEIENAEDINTLVSAGWLDRTDDVIRMHPILVEVALSYNSTPDLIDAQCRHMYTTYFSSENALPYLVQYARYCFYSAKKYSKHFAFYEMPLFHAGLFQDRELRLNDAEEAMGLLAQKMSRCDAEHELGYHMTVLILAGIYLKQYDRTQRGEYLDKVPALLESTVSQPTSAENVDIQYRALQILRRTFNEQRNLEQAKKTGLRIRAMRKVLSKENDCFEDAIELLYNAGEKEKSEKWDEAAKDFDRAKQSLQELGAYAERTFFDEYIKTEHNNGIWFFEKGNIDASARCFGCAIAESRRIYGERGFRTAREKRELAIRIMNVSGGEELALTTLKDVLPIYQEQYGNSDESVLEIERLISSLQNKI